MVHMDDLNDEGVMIRTCHKCQYQTVDDWELMAIHLEECGVNCKTCRDSKTKVLDRNGDCYNCGGYRKWKGKDNMTAKEVLEQERSRRNVMDFGNSLMAKADAKSLKITLNHSIDSYNNGDGMIVSEPGRLVQFTIEGWYLKDA